MLSLNPYIAGNPVGGTPNFVGRADVLREVLRVMRQPHQNIIVLYGQRRIGKTSVLQQLAAQLPNEGNFYPVYFDLQDKASWSLGRVLTDLARALSYELTRQGPPSMKQTGPLLNDADPVKAFQDTWLPATLNRLPEGHSIVLLFDEFDVLADPKGGQAGADLFPYLRGLMATDPTRLQFAFVIGRKVEDLESIALSLFKGAPALRVSLLNKVDTFELVRLSERNETLRWSEASLEKVWHLTHGHPFLTQQLCSRLWENLYDSDPTGVPTVLPEDVEHAILETLEASRNTLEWLWDGLPPAERVVISALAGAGDRAITQPQLEQLLRESGVRVVIRELQNAPQLLQDWDLIEPAEGGYRFRVELFRRWILEHKPLSRVQEELDRIEPLAENLYQAAYGFFRTNQLEDALPLLRQAIGLNPNHARSRQLLAEIFLLRGEVDQAVQILQMLYDTQPAVARPRLVQALLLKAEDEPDEEKRNAIYQQILLVDPSHPLVSQRVAESQRVARQRELAQHLGELQKAEKDKRYRDALDLARKAVEKYPDERDWQADLDRLERKTKLAEDYQRAIGALNSGDKEAAIRGLVEVIVLEPDYEEVTRYLHLAKTGHDPVLMMNQLAGEQKAHNRAKTRLDEEISARTDTEKQRDELQIRLESEKLHTASYQRMSRRMTFWALASTFLAIAFFIAWYVRGVFNDADMEATQTAIAQGLTEIADLAEDMSATPEKLTETLTETLPAMETAFPTETPSPLDVTPTATYTATQEVTALPTSNPFGGLAPENALARLGKGEISSIALSHDGSFLAVAASTGVYVYNANTFETHWQASTPARVTSLAFSLNGLLGAGLADGTLNVWNEETGAEIQTESVHQSAVLSLAFSADGNSLVSGAEDGMIILWNTADWTHVNFPDGHPHGVYALAFSPDGNRVASGADDAAIILWDVSQRASPERFADPYSTNADVWSLAWSKDDVLAAGLDDATIIRWDLTTNEISDPLTGHAEAVRSVAWSPDGQLASSSSDNLIIIWDLEKDAPGQFLSSHTGEVTSVVWDQNETPFSGSKDGTVIRWEVSSRRPAQTLLGFTSPIRSIAYSPDGTILASGGEDGIVRLWDTTSGGLIRPLQGHTDAITSLSFSSDGLTLASASLDRSILLWDVETGEAVGAPITQPVPILSVAFSPVDNARLAFGTQGGEAAIINWVTGETFASLTGHESAINTLDYSSDGNSLASGSDGGIVIVWDTGSGVALHTLGDKEEGHQEQVLSVAFTVNDTLLGSSSADNSIILWNFLSEQQVGKYIFGTTVWSLAFSDESWMAAGLMDHSVVMWQLTRFVESTSPQVTLLGHQGDVLDLAFSPSANILATASNDGTIVLWDVSQITQ